jgi:hypothetical protein
MQGNDPQPVGGLRGEGIVRCRRMPGLRFERDPLFDKANL